jgi:hypothetical protein
MSRIVNPASLALALAFCAAAADPTPQPEHKSPSRPAAEPAQNPLTRAIAIEGMRVRRLSSYGAPPYYVDVTVEDGENLTLASSWGEAYPPQHVRYRIQYPSVRVGSPALDNTGYIGSGFSADSRFDSEYLPLDNDLTSLRTAFWLSFDHAYKTAVEALGRKQAALNYYTAHDRPPDFTPAPRVAIQREIKRIAVDEARWSERTRLMSAQFRGRAGVIEADAEFTWSAATLDYYNSDGTAVHAPDNLATVALQATASLGDGGEVRNGLQYVALDPALLPSESELKSAAAQAASDLDALVKAPAGAAYTGPVLFEPYAAAQLFAEVFGQELAITRKPVAEQGRNAPVVESALENKIGSRVLPTFLSLRDDARQKQWNNAPLAGFYEIDLEGVEPAPVTLVDKGLLKSFLTTRQPIENGAASNGHARLPGPFGAKTARPGNLFVEASQTVSDARLRQQLLELIRQQKKPYALVVRRMDYPSQAAPGAVREMAQRQARSGGAARLYSAPLLLVRLYADGHEELARGLRFRGFTVRVFRDILAAGAQPAAFSYVDDGAPMALRGAGSFVVGCSAVAPAVLFEELELEPASDETARAPLVPPPPAQ